MKIPLLSISYLPPISYVAACICSGEMVIEKHEHFVKQTHRNRTLIYSANGILPLIIPVQHSSLSVLPIHEVKIAYDLNWQKSHWQSLVSAYRNSAFFDYYEDDFRSFYLHQHQTLFEFDMGLLNILFRLLKAQVTISFTTAYQKAVPAMNDLRNAFHADKHNTVDGKPSENRYRQVFATKHGFIPNLSIVDLLFNEGPQSVDFLSRISQF